jgi:ketosteroid isomerase-like protein
MSKHHKITDPSQSNATFAKVFNEGRNIDAWLSLYEPGATLFGGPQPAIGHDPIRKALKALAKVPGKIETRVNFSAINGDIAVTRADYRFVNQGKVLQMGSAVEVLRLQADEHWLFIIDHEAGVSVPSACADESRKD